MKLRTEIKKYINTKYNSIKFHPNIRGQMLKCGTSIQSQIILKAFYIFIKWHLVMIKQVAVSVCSFSISAKIWDAVESLGQISMLARWSISLRSRAD